MTVAASARGRETDDGISGAHRTLHALRTSSASEDYVQEALHEQRDHEAQLRTDYLANMQARFEDTVDRFESE